jgi:membrane protease YdiL (CAAX protease family)
MKALRALVALLAVFGVIVLGASIGHALMTGIRGLALAAMVLLWLCLILALAWALSPKGGSDAR